MIDLSHYIQTAPIIQKRIKSMTPWAITTHAKGIIVSIIEQLDTEEFIINNHIAVHRQAIIEQQVILKEPIIISAGCFVGVHTYLRGGVFLDEHVSIGPGCEIKSSFIMSHSALAHFNFVGDSLLGNHINMEAGSIIANHYNEREDKLISVSINGSNTATGITKFGALVGDHTKIGANAVLSPGTILPPNTIVKRLELVEQMK